MTNDDLLFEYRHLPIYELLNKLENKTEKDLKYFMEIAERIFETDKKIIDARNNYISITDLLKREEDMMDEFEMALDQYSKTIKEKKSGENENEKIISMFEKITTNTTDEDDEIVSLLNDNYRLIDELNMIINEKKN